MRRYGLLTVQAEWHGLSLGLSVTIEMPFVLWTRVDPKKHMQGRAVHWRNLANTIEPSMCGGDAAFTVKLL